MYAIRGAVTVKKNKEKDIIGAVKTMIGKIIAENNLKKEEIINFTFSTTDDLDVVYPGKAVREMGFTKTTILCLQEMNVNNSLNKCIRVLLYINNDLDKDKVKHIYLNKAAKLRKDLNFISEEQNNDNKI
ncbi:MAG: chorismate mutase [Halanaerobiales bacterium]